jgi:hypothetical protein
MPEHEVRGDRAVYDHETEDPRAARRRPVADWGVGEEIFDRMPSPRRRFGRTTEAPPARRDSHPRERRFEPARDVAPRGDEPRGVAPRRDEPRGVAPREVAPRRDEPRELAPREVATCRAEPREVAPRGAARGGVEGRRTVVIGGQASVARRPRPSRTAVERVGPRPDRIAAYAVALGLLLIVIAFLTQ